MANVFTVAVMAFACLLGVPVWTQAQAELLCATEPREKAQGISVTNKAVYNVAWNL